MSPRITRFNPDGTVRSQSDPRSLREAKQEAIFRIRADAENYRRETFEAEPTENNLGPGIYEAAETLLALAGKLAAAKNTEISTKYVAWYQHRRNLLIAARAATTLAEADAVNWSTPA